MTTLTVSLGPRSYPIHVGAGLLGRPELLDPHLPGPQVLVVTNVTVAPLYLDRISAGLEGREVRTLALPDGEAHKTLAVLQSVFDALMEARFARDCTIVALGGGVVGDLAGFAAASYQRGVAFVQIPTTLLAQVDSSVGGKTAVNHPLGKNMIGAFHQPTCVLADTDTLATLPERELRAGLAEVIKYGVICNAEFFAWIEAHLDALLAREPAALAHAVEVACTDKARIVAEDERERGSRALLNLGHTFAHAIEAGLGFGTWLHGEAVAAGMVLAGDLATRMGTLTRDELERIVTLLERAGLPVAVPAPLDPEQMLALMGRDKKVLAGRLRLVLPQSVGGARVVDDFDVAALRAVLAERRAA